MKKTFISDSFHICLPPLVWAFLPSNGMNHTRQQQPSRRFSNRGAVGSSVRCVGGGDGRDVAAHIGGVLGLAEFAEGRDPRLEVRLFDGRLKPLVHWAQGARQVGLWIAGHNS